MLSLNKSYKNRKVSLTIHCKYEYFDSAVQRAEDSGQTSSLTSLLSFHGTSSFVPKKYVISRRNISITDVNDLQNVQPLSLRGFIRSRQPAKITVYLARICFLLPPTLSVFSLKVLKNFISLPPNLVSSDDYSKTY